MEEAKKRRTAVQKLICIIICRKDTGERGGGEEAAHSGPKAERWGESSEPSLVKRNEGSEEGEQITRRENGASDAKRVHKQLQTL